MDIKISKVIYNTIIFLILAASGFLLFVYFGKFDFASAYIVTSGSMAPAIDTGSIVFSVKSDTYKPGDIITFTNGDNKTHITHRIIYKDYQNNNFITSGDANEDLDRWTVTSENVKGKVLFTIPYAGYLANFAKEPYGFILFIIVPATIIIYEELKQLISESIKSVKSLLRKKRRILTNKINLLPQKNNFALPKIAIAIPLVGSFIVFASLSGSFFSDIENSIENVLSAATNFATAGPTPTPAPTAQNPIINELLPNPDPPSDPEWIELYNPNNAGFDLTGWNLVDAANSSRPLPSQIIPPLSYFVYETPEGWLNNSSPGDTITLIDPLSNPVDQYTYTTDVADNRSFARIPDTSGGFVLCQIPTKGLTNICP
ncbi:signal peptidase I [Candidatus Woesebacteria bacterium RIFCSPHIGHO2_02_FULL_42_20]|uniref:Signal peptidase I n=1 Tax=Candidatus Woesebacteria bacterium RIFCSPHIGHO2_12_FULL_41_24 TaxID=1802510 RepID=A0A1F8AVT2_9BACT|nr:MAG: signal peptidase I [Candidatus Woesebacteria bacterium RBG_16_41_13]OGM30763.1 MAG: signal peptidase I [Candidatus Woesebacteria bacterium RIFCSPHIGHO2_01_FULL_42_80]OGM34185.1 MAG: signal peptidase I [Candidatus Woesebacteria bacterium RIFCSPHIGHO2_02_FULL_42_20]OGM55358.1 MAG: signal peptidase I [Candidatus Woesebacteria bacterium RIFCSPHIGHO2_12_FULL_41_24]OGM67895.1 MAG: signal peptidase I [Candidatus Woesebacteria bacterium RIFCSPLOWO2_01_FULL_42_67]OGM69521.1 MAG: signal peptidas